MHAHGDDERDEAAMSSHLGDNLRSSQPTPIDGQSTSVMCMMVFQVCKTHGLC